MKTFGLTLSLAGFVCFCFADPLTQWHWRAPTPDHGSLFDCVTFQNGLFIAAGFGVLAVSSDGRHWTNCSLGTVYEVQSIAYGNGTYVGVGTGHSYTSEQPFGVVVTSPDGIHWTEQAPPGNMTSLSSIAFGSGKFVAVGQRGLGNAMLTSTNGINWTVRNQTGVNSEDMLTNDWHAVTFGYGKFVATGVNYDYPSGGHAPISTSPDGITWYVRDSSSSPYTVINSVIYANGKFVAVGGQVLVSLDGVNWIRATERVGFDESITYGSSLFVAVGQQIKTSPDAMTWTEQVSNTSNELKSVAYGNGTFVAVGRGVLLVSSNAVDWIPLLDSGTPTHLSGVAYGGGQFVAVGYGGLILRSPDGAQWTRAISGTANVLGAVTWGANSFVAVGHPKFPSWDTRGTLLSSCNGIDWVGTETGHFTNGFTTVAYGNGLFIAAASEYGIVFTSTNALDWVEHEVGSSVRLWSIAFGNGIFVGTETYLGTVGTSPDGVHWAEHNTGATNTPLAVAFGNGRFVVLGTGFAQTSTNGINWSPVGYLPSWYFPRRAVYAQGTFVCVGDYGLIATSINGLDWVIRNSGTGTRLWSVAYGQRTCVAVGEYGTILQSDPVDMSAVQLSCSEGRQPEPLRIILQGISGQTWQLQRSADLSQWTTISDLTLTNASAEFVDYSVTNSPRQFYRAVSP